MTLKPTNNTHNTLSEKNPFPGLRPFGIEESHLFFGRDGQSERVLEYLSKNRFAAVTGASGSGKSSLMYCGVIPLLHGGFIKEAGSKWKIIAARPGNSPVENLASAISKNEKGLKYSDDGHIKKKIVYTILRRSSYGLVDAIKQMNLGNDENLLLIIDQFEELFRFKESRKDSTTLNETEAFIKLIVNAVNQKEQSIYLAITMRSDFIGECSQFQELTRLINTSNFLIPQMTREDFKEAILGPVAVGHAKIDPKLTQHVLNSISDHGDQLPILQHAMMRTWDYWTRHNAQEDMIRMRDYEAAGKVENALSMHANEAYEELTDSGKKICKTIFRILTEKGADNKGIRHPARVSDIAAIAQVTDDEVIEVADKFRAKERSFITPTEGMLINKDTVLDISHESLMRIWDKLKVWVDEESSSVQMYLRLADAATQFQLGKTGLWRPPDLQLALNWRKTQQPSLAWAKKYNPAFEKVMVFLDASEKKYQQEEQNKIRVQRRVLSRTRRFAMIMGVFALLFLALVFYANEQKKDADGLRKEAEAWALIMESQKDEAVEETQIKEIERLKAKLSADSSERAKREALLLTRRALEEKDIALETAEMAQQESQEAEKTVSIERQQRTQAELNAQVAKQQQTEAEKQAAEDFAKRMLSIAQSLSVKATQESGDKDLKALLALQSFKFNEQYNGMDNHPDIYKGLYSAMTAIYGKDYNVYMGHEGSVRTVKFLPRSNILYSTGSDGKILIWDIASGSKSPRTLKNNNFINRSLSISPNGRWLACGVGTSSIQLFNLNQDGSQPVLLEGHKGWVGDLEFLPNNNALISTSTDKTVIYWDLIQNTHKEIAVSDVKINTICISADGRWLYGGSDNGDLIKWNISKGNAEVLFSSPKNIILSLAISNSGGYLAFGDKLGVLRIYNLNTNKLIYTKKAHVSRIQDINFSPNNQLLATASNDGTIKIWNLRKFDERPVVITEHEDWVFSVDFSPDGKYLASSSQNGKIFIWPATANIMADEICPKISRNLTTNEWNTYIGYDIEYQKTCTDK
ncbi:MAG: hypothetical protein JXJ22_17775 [Bacteroidales bacterium]|nr:hypothetical protein [Bacteroidales bacterium]